MSYKIITDATSDLPKQLASAEDVLVMPMGFTLAGKSHMYTPGDSDITTHEFADLLRSGEQAVTTQINTFTFGECFERYLKEGIDVIYIGFSSGLSGTINSAKLAREELLAKYPDRKIACIDSLSASLGEGLLVYNAARRRNELSFDEMVDWVETHKLNLIHWFTVDDLNHLKRGGRISGATAAIGTVLRIKPVMHVDDDGHLIAVGKVQGRKKSLKQLVDNMLKTLDKELTDVIFVGNCDCVSEAEYVAQLVKESTGVENIVIDDIGPMIGTHSGPGTVALFTFGSTRKPL